MQKASKRLYKTGEKMIGFIVNPIAGGGKGIEQWKRIEQACKERRIPYRVNFTNYEGHGIVLAKQAAKDANLDLIIAVGGDGTANEVANGLYLSSIPMGYIPAGTGNDFARVMKTPKDPVQALNQILSSEIKKMDIVTMRGRKFLNIAGIGFDGEVSLTANRSIYKKWLGKLSYIISVIQVLFTYKPTDVWLTVDGKKHHFNKVWLIAVANVPYYGGGMKICPSAVWDDGWLDICIVHNISRIKLLFLFPLVFAGKHVNLKAVKFSRGKQVSVESMIPLQIHADGELLGQTPVDIQIESQPFNIVI